MRLDGTDGLTLHYKVREPPSSIRFPQPLRERVLQRATAERRTFSNAVLVLVEAGLAVADLRQAEPEQRIATLEDRLRAEERALAEARLAGSDEAG